MPGSTTLSKPFSRWHAPSASDLAAYQRRSNDHIMTCLGMRSPNEVLDLYRGIM